MRDPVIAPSKYLTRLDRAAVARGCQYRLRRIEEVVTDNRLFELNQDDEEVMVTLSSGEEQLSSS
jgi:hypothetical protein